MIINKAKYIKLSILEKQKYIKIIKDKFERKLAKELNLTRVSAPLFVTKESGLQDDLSGIERKVSFDIKKDGKEINVLIPYDLIESIFGGVVEFSNCHSFELDSKGNMIIKYGNLSLMPKRHKLNFSDTIENWNEFFNNTEIDYILINVNNFHYHRDGEYGIIEIYVDLFFKKNIVSKVVLVFDGVTDCEFIMDEPSYNLAICQLIDGSFFAQINYMSEFKFKRCYIETLIDNE